MTVTIQSPKLVQTSFDVRCGQCSFSGTVSYDGPNITTLEAGIINFNSTKCPSCGAEDIYAPGGKYERNEETGKMTRTGDYQES